MGPKYTWPLIVVLLSSRGFLSAVAQQQDDEWGFAAVAYFGGSCLGAFLRLIQLRILERKRRKDMEEVSGWFARAELERKKRKEMEQVSGWFVEGVDDDSVREGNASFAEENELEPDILDLDDIKD